MSSCPSTQTIDQFANDQLSGSRYASMEAHVETCSACQEILERLATEMLGCETDGAERPTLPDQPPTIPGFLIERELGRGGMGVVYQAWQPHLDRRVAVKVVNASALTGVEDRRRWLREARAIGRIRHRNVVQLLEAGEHDGCLYLVLDLIRGGSLAERVTGPLPHRVAVELMLAMARAVDHVHKSGMLHLDIKSSNILLDGPAGGPWDEVTPMLADFGIARAGDDAGATASGLVGVRGTPSFMAPEQITGDRSAIGPRSDVYALGATLYSLLTGRPPFQAASVIETLDLVRTQEPALPRTLVPGLPRDLETIALSCLRKDPRRRYASAEALADDLNRWLGGFPIHARPVSQLEHAGRWCRRRPAVASLLAVLVLTVAWSLVGLVTLWRHSENERSRAENALARAIASDKATTGAVGDLVGLLASPVDEPQMQTYERLVESSRVVRDLAAKLRQNRGIAASNLIAICGLERDLALVFTRRAKYSESRHLLMDVLELLDGRRSGGLDLDVELAYARALVDLGAVAEFQQLHDEALGWLNRAELVLAGLANEPRNVEAIILIDDARRNIAGLMGREGHDESRRSLLELEIGMLERLSERPGADPAIGILAALSRADLAPEKNADADLRAAIKKFAVLERLPEKIGFRVSGWIARDIHPFRLEPKSQGKPPGRPDPDDHARLVIRALDSKCEALGVYPALVPRAANRVCDIALGQGMEQRKAGRIDDARWTAAALEAFAKLLVERDPGEAEFHLVLAEAYDQKAKNAFRLGDVNTVEAATRNALVEASTAIRLDPRSTYARLKVSGLQEKIVSQVLRRRVRR